MPMMGYQSNITSSSHPNNIDAVGRQNGPVYELSRIKPVLTFIASTLPKKSARTDSGKLKNLRNSRSSSQTSLDAMVRPLKSILKRLKIPSKSQKLPTSKQVHFASQPAVYEYEMDVRDGDDKRQLRKVSSIRRKKSPFPERSRSPGQGHNQRETGQNYLDNPDYDIVTGSILIPIHSQNGQSFSLRQHQENNGNAENGFLENRENGHVYHNAQDVPSKIIYVNQQQEPTHWSHNGSGYHDNDQKHIEIRPVQYGSIKDSENGQYQNYTDTLKRSKKGKQADHHAIIQYGDAETLKHHDRQLPIQLPISYNPRKIIVPVTPMQYVTNNAMRFIDQAKNDFGSRSRSNGGSINLPSPTNNRADYMPKFKIVFVEAKP